MVCYPMGGRIYGVRGEHVLLAPLFIMDEGQKGEVGEAGGGSGGGVLDLSEQIRMCSVR